MIKENRERSGLTQEYVAERAGISWRQFQRIEKNENQTKISTLKAIIKILNISDKEILDFIHKP